MRHHTRLTPLGDRALLVEVGHAIDAATQERVLAVYQALGDARIAGVTELVPAYTSVAVHYEPAHFERDGAMPYDELARIVARIVDGPLAARREKPRVIEIPVRYGGIDGPDLDDVARHTGLTPDEVIRAHAAAEYTVGMVGFTAGFPYLAGLPKGLAVPRRASPRTEVPKGSVGIGGEQTGIYPMSTPGGWNLIGRTSLELFSPTSDPPTLLQPGDHVRFVPVFIAESP